VLQVVQYRGQIMPLINIASAVELSETDVGGSSAPANSALQVLVYSESGRSVGLVVDRILDIVEEEILVEKVGERGYVVHKMNPGARGALASLCLHRRRKNELYCAVKGESAGSKKMFLSENGK